MYRSVIISILAVILSSTGLAQNKKVALTEPQIATALQSLQQQLLKEKDNTARVTLIKEARKVIEARINEVAMDQSIPFPVVARHYRMGDQLIVLGLLKAKDASSMTADSCLNARNQVSLSGYDPLEEERVIPKHLTSVARVIEYICPKPAVVK